MGQAQQEAVRPCWAAAAVVRLRSVADSIGSGTPRERLLARQLPHRARHVPHAGLDVEAQLPACCLHGRARHVKEDNALKCGMEFVGSALPNAFRPTAALTREAMDLHHPCHAHLPTSIKVRRLKLTWLEESVGTKAPSPQQGSAGQLSKRDWTNWFRQYFQLSVMAEGRIKG